MYDSTAAAVRNVEINKSDLISSLEKCAILVKDTEAIVGHLTIVKCCKRGIDKTLWDLRRGRD